MDKNILKQVDLIESGNEFKLVGRTFDGKELLHFVSDTQLKCINEFRCRRKLDWKDYQLVYEDLTQYEDKPTTIEGIANDFIAHMEEIDKSVVMKMSKDEVRSLHHSVGMNIRNYYELWLEGNPLTNQWFEDRKDNGRKFIVDGVDAHPNHPDQISDQVLCMIWDKIHEARC